MRYSLLLSMLFSKNDNLFVILGKCSNHIDIFARFIPRIKTESAATTHENCPCTVPTLIVYYT